MKKITQTIQKKYLFSIVSVMVAFAFVFNPSFADARPMTLTALGANLGVGASGSASGDLNRSKLDVDARSNVNVGDDRDEGDDRDDRGERDGRDNNFNRIYVGAIGAASMTASSSFPRGIQHALGIEKRLEDGKGFPSGLWGWFARKFGVHATTTASTTVDASLPNIKKIDAVAATSSVRITWQTNEVTTGEVRYSLDNHVNVNDSVAIDSVASTSHSVYIPNLKVDTKYYFTISAKDSSGNTKVTGTMKFHTKSEAKILEKLRIFFNTSIETSANSSRIVWFTNYRSDSKIWVSTNSNVATNASATAYIADEVFLHSITLSGLSANTKYYYVIESDANLNANASSSATNGSVNGAVNASLKATATGSFTTEAN